MKNTRHFLLSAIFLAVGLGAVIAADASAAPSIEFGKLSAASLKNDPNTVITFSDPELQKLAGGKRVDELRAFVKEGVDAKAQVATLQQQNQQQQLVAEYYKAVAEKNDAVLRLVAMQQELMATKAELEKVKAELDAAKKPAEAKK